MSAEAAVRLGVFLAVLALMLATERWLPRRGLSQRRLRWPSNFALVVLDTVLLRLLLPAGAAGVAIWAQGRGIGFWNSIPAPGWVAVGVSVLALDLLIYWQHRLFHKIPMFWRLHRVHHSDVEFDVTTALRFHPIEILLSMLIKIGAVLALGAPFVAVVAFEVILNATAMFNHANLRLPLSLDRVLRLVLVTPDMHRIHHSVLRVEHNSNFGFNFPWSDRLFGSYTDQPRSGHQDMVIGLPQFREADSHRIGQLLVQPLTPG